MLFPGLVALAAVLTGLQSTALPLVIEFSYSNEIEDRLLAPLPIGAVADGEGGVRGHAGMCGRCGHVPGRRAGSWGRSPGRPGTAAAVVVMTIVGALLGAAMGLILGTFVPPNRISVALTWC